jgi:hypothetical protein
MAVVLWATGPTEAKPVLSSNRQKGSLRAERFLPFSATTFIHNGRDCCILKNRYRKYGPIGECLPNGTLKSIPYVEKT